ncbi:heat shock protein beta-11-like [Bufo bufo]|uniref:heat shock protein beta-11-like n=1 Tax=Bufo bufo TaxID=8384 RepID=UPI001ABE1E0C|nr:heat shock protein beta-11-like [Bufo bufo]
MLSLQLAKKSSPSPFRSFFQPLWPLSIDIFSSLEKDMIRTVGEIKANMKLMDQFYQQLLQETTESKNLLVLNSSNTKSIENKAEIGPAVSNVKLAEGGLTVFLGVQDFTPQELTVKLVGSKLLVSGAKECKSEDGKGSFSYKCQIFRKEVDLPEDVRAEDLSCTVDKGKLQIEVSKKAAQERTVPIQHTALQAKTKTPVSGSSKD